jgi:hypothetical protein
VDCPWILSFRIRHAWVFLSRFGAPSGLWRLWFPCMTNSRVPRATAVLPWPIPDLGILSVPLNLGAVLVLSGYGWRV